MQIEKLTILTWAKKGQKASNHKRQREIFKFCLGLKMTIKLLNISMDSTVRVISEK